MATRRTDEASRLTSGLAGANLALSIAREATDAVPIVKQVLGAALRIVGLAEKMDSDREALRALGASSIQLAQQVRALVAGKTMNEGIQASLERILKALDDIESFMTEHAARSRLRRLISYAFTVPQHIKRLSGELGDAVRDLTVVVLLATHASIQDNAQFEGEFRLIRHCEVQRLDRISNPVPGDEDRDGKAVVRYYRAQVDGHLLVVRYFEGHIPPDSTTVSEPTETLFDRLTAHDRILEELSMVQRSHPNVASIYGWSKGSVHNRFTVLKAGYRPLHSLFPDLPDRLTTIVHWTITLLDQDTFHHLSLMGIAWKPRVMPSYMVDDKLEPTIGLEDDLCRIEPDEDTYRYIIWITLPFYFATDWKTMTPADIDEAAAGCHNEQLTNLLGTVERAKRRRDIIQKANFTHEKALNNDIVKDIIQLLAEKNIWMQDWIWANILMALDKNQNYRITNSVYVFYVAESIEDEIWLRGLHEDSEHIVYDSYILEVQDTQRDDLRGVLRISAPVEGETIIRYMATGTYHAPK